MDHFTACGDGHVLVIGAAGVDMVGRLQGDLRMETSNPSQIRSSFGGIARNVAENLARLGQEVVLISAVGDDQAGESLVTHTAKAGVNVSAVIRTPETRTGTYLAVVNPRGELVFALDDMQAIASITPRFLKSKIELFDEACLLFVDTNLSPETLRTAISLAHRRKIPICADPTSSPLARRLRPYLGQINLVTPNAHEAGVLCDLVVDASKRRQTLAAAKCLVSQGVEIAIITLGAYGVCYATSESSGFIPAIRTEVVDPTGGGDALSAAVIFALLNEMPLDDAIRLGVSAATLTLRYPGAVIPDLTLEILYDQLVI